MIFGHGVDSEAGTYTVFEEIRISATCACNRILAVVVAKQQEVNGRTALAALVTAHREECRQKGDMQVIVETISPERKVPYRTPTPETNVPPSASELRAAQLSAEPVKS